MWGGGGGEEGVFVIICRSRDLPEGHGVTVSRYSITVLYIVRERYSDEAMNNFVKQTKASISPPLLQCTPS